jgi:hypothetical protein
MVTKPGNITTPSPPASRGEGWGEGGEGREEKTIGNEYKTSKPPNGTCKPSTRGSAIPRGFWRAIWSNLLTKEKGGKNFDPQSSQTLGGSAWESNPRTAFSRRHTGFEALTARPETLQTRMVDTSTWHRVAGFTPCHWQPAHQPMYNYMRFERFLPNINSWPFAVCSMKQAG